MIKKYWKLAILIIISSFVIANPVFAVTIVTGEKSQDNDE